MIKIFRVGYHSIPCEASDLWLSYIIDYFDVVSHGISAYSFMVLACVVMCIQVQSLLF